MQKDNQALVAYVPTPHQGYITLFKKYPDATLYILGLDIINDFQPLVRNLPANTPMDARSMVLSLGIFPDVRILTKKNIGELRGFARIVMPEEDVSEALAEKYLSNHHVTFDGSWRLRWDWGASTKKSVPTEQVISSSDAFDRLIMSEAFRKADKSSDWWRQVGAVLVRDRKIMLVAFNKHQPSEQSPYLYGDPRSNFGPGEFIEYSSAAHAEATIIATAARRGLSTKGCHLYVTTFPCPPCAYLCAESGISHLFYSDGYSLVEGATSLRSKGVEIVRVEKELPPPR